MMAFIGLILAFFSFLGMCLSAIGIKLCWVFGIIGAAVAGLAGAGLFACIWMAILWTLAALAMGLLGVVMSLVAAAISLALIES